MNILFGMGLSFVFWESTFTFLGKVSTFFLSCTIADDPSTDHPSDEPTWADLVSEIRTPIEGVSPPRPEPMPMELEPIIEETETTETTETTENYKPIFPSTDLLPNPLPIRDFDEEYGVAPVHVDAGGSPDESESGTVSPCEDPLSTTETIHDSANDDEDQKPPKTEVSVQTSPRRLPPSLPRGVPSTSGLRVGILYLQSYCECRI